jgi:chromosome partitioning protein
MTVVIAFVSQKGGVGKSTLARALAREAAVSSKLKVRLADLDTMQKTTSDWHAKRLQNGLKPIADVQILANAEQALAHADAYDLVIIDSPARAPTGTREIAKRATLVVQPTGPSDDDIAPAVREFHGLVKAGIPKKRLVFALNHVGTDAEESAARALIEEAGYDILDGCLMERPAYRTAHNFGRAITETNFATLNARADELIQSLFDRISADG